MTCQLIWELDKDDPEIALRLRPLREHWEARGPGLLTHIRSHFPWLEIPDQVVVQLVSPHNGGAGKILSHEKIQFEAVLFNPLPQLPEVVRLSWLCSCLGLGGHRESVAVIPLVIQAAQHVELATADESTIQCALNNWFDERISFISASTLSAWWCNHGLSTSSSKVACLTPGSFDLAISESTISSGRVAAGISSANGWPLTLYSRR